MDKPILATPSIAILASGGLDSAILLFQATNEYGAVWPLYVRHGLFWEPAELAHLRRYLQAIHTPALRTLHVLDMPVADLYADHWSVTGKCVPDNESADEAVFLPGRNVLLLAKGILWCHLRGVPAIALAPLLSNPFPDATPKFFAAYQDIVNHAVGGAVQVLRPYAHLSKVELMGLGRGLLLELTFSCIRPVDGKHCGRCNKCAERRQAFLDADIHDRTEYKG
jgi:7-cyano-7-deazaguanine synthase